MSLVTFIRDYVDVANSSEQLNGYTFSSLAYSTLGFIFSILKQVIVNFCTLQWIQDFSYFCLTPPMLFSSFANINISERTSEDFQSLSNLVAFSETHFLGGVGLIFLGFFNGCFTSIHISAANLITIQRLLVNGVPAGLCSAFGTAVGQCFFLACIHFGFRTLLFPWLSIEPLPFLIGIGILFAIASNSAQDKRRPTIQWSAKSFLLTYTFTSVALAWCEQTALFQLMGNLSFGAEPTLLETTGTIIGNSGTIAKVIQQGSYLLAFFFGNFLGTFFLASILQRLLESLLSFKGIPIYYGLIKQANLPLATLIFAFGFGSLPYYGFDYLITKGFGFIPQEQFFQQTLFSPVNLVSKTPQTKDQARFEDQLALLFTLEGEKNKSFVIDTTPFDDGQYLKAGQKRPQAFEDLNYRGEYLWTNRIARINSIKEQANPTQSSFLGPAFSWMRSILWGEGSTTSNVFNNNASQYPEGVKANFNKNESSLTIGSNENSIRKRELSGEEEQLDNYVTEFERQFDKGFSNFQNAKPISLIEVEDQWQEQRIKKKCYTNPIYKFLLNIEIDSFLRRQPNYHRLSAEEEILLLKRRQLLSDYYDTLVFTSQIPTSQAFDELVPKSYTNTVYNHQFKGTLKIARRLFSIKQTLTPYPAGVKEFPILQASKNNFEKSRIVKFDQPLFNNLNSGNSPGNSHSIPERSEATEQKPPRNSQLRVPGKPFTGYQRTPKELTNFHEELNESINNEINSIPYKGTGVSRSAESNSQFQKSIDKNVFLLEQAESLPLYASWDEGLRKLILTNRFQSRIKAGYTYSAGQDNASQPIQSQVLQEKNPAGSLDSNISFTAWPLPNPPAITNTISNQARSLAMPLPSHTSLESETLQKNRKNNDSLIQKASQRGEGTNIFKFVPNLVDSLTNTTFHLPSFLFPTQSIQSFNYGKEPVPNDMINALLQWQKLIKDNKQLSKEDKQAAKEKVSYWPQNVRRANWSTELMDNDIEFDVSAENALKKQKLLWEFVPPNYGGFIWPGVK